MRRKKQQKPNYYNFDSIFFHIHFFGIIFDVWGSVGVLIVERHSYSQPDCDTCFCMPIWLHAAGAHYLMEKYHSIHIRLGFFSLSNFRIYRKNEWNVDKIKLSFVIATYHEANAQAHTMQLRKWLPRWQWERKRKMLHEAAVLRKWNWTFVIVTNSNWSLRFLQLETQHTCHLELTLWSAFWDPLFYHDSFIIRYVINGFSKASQPNGNHFFLKFRPYFQSSIMALMLQNVKNG